METPLRQGPGISGIGVSHHIKYSNHATDCSQQSQQWADWISTDQPILFEDQLLERPSRIRCAYQALFRCGTEPVSSRFF
jgi:hypothetical protein